MRKKIILFTIFSIFVLAQSQSYSQISGYGTVNILDMRRFIGASTLQSLFFLLTLLLILPLMKRNFTEQNRKFFNMLIIISSLAIISILLLTNNKIAGVRTVVDYYSPLYYLFIFSVVKWEKTDFSYFLRIISYIFYFNLLANLIQWLFFNYKIDNLQGILANAHQNAEIMHIGSLYFITKYWIYKQRKYLVFSLVPIVISLVASNDKATIFFSITVISVYIIIKHISLMRVLKVISTLLITILLISLLFRTVNKEKSSALLGGLGRFEIVEKQELSVKQILLLSPQINAYLKVPEIYYENVYPVFLGVGPTMFGSEEVDKTSKFSKISLQTNVFSLLGSTALGRGTSFFLVLLYEFGFVAFMIYLFFIKYFFIFTNNLRNISLNKKFQHLFLWLFSYLIFIVLLSLVSREDGLAGTANTIPFFILLGMLHSYVQYNLVEFKTDK